jgi:hypothetical protein
MQAIKRIIALRRQLEVLEQKLMAEHLSMKGIKQREQTRLRVAKHRAKQKKR